MTTRSAPALPPAIAEAVLAGTERSGLMRNLERGPERLAVPVVESGYLVEIELSWPAPAAGSRADLPDRPVLQAGELVLEEWYGLHCEYFLG